MPFRSYAPDFTREAGLAPAAFSPSQRDTYWLSYREGHSELADHPAPRGSPRGLMPLANNWALRTVTAVTGYRRVLPEYLSTRGGCGPSACVAAFGDGTLQKR